MPHREIQAGDEVEFAAVTWDDQWEFDCPHVMYEGAKRYTPNGHGTHADHLEHWIEDVLIDVVVDGKIRVDFHESDLKEFQWRGWSVPRFPKRAGVHLRMKVRFEHNRHGELTFTVLSKTESRIGKSYGGEARTRKTRRKEDVVKPGSLFVGEAKTKAGA